ncbi:cupin domain-containing protein [Pseudomonas vancouverensis]|uniref:Cupin domain-containing protein n=1 Tax=Pseudomonas vancouverensis TaxID=95300 RepID=A0A1H2P9H3_PSEVA|nr:cupin domain-containing protein [Pseudomonas vancouverensis]KAB0500317.1 cupin domain-containing protein [Pseudomonas vancouverensis]TDB58939.1 cupin domain-containing protein [Pseudomonas vancouverensis]SDV14011.1 gentisate 1,2-dioxygenase [Pseudomonas vancouverensis]
MDNFQGAFFSYADFRKNLHHKPVSAKVWRHSELAGMRQTLEASDVDIVALAHDKSLQGCEVTPGMAIAMQWLNPGVTLNGHAHSWWHLFIIQCGNGLLTLGDADEVNVSSGDVLLVPAWTRHGFVNTSKHEPLAMLNMSNMPQMALLSNFADSQGLITTQA